MAIAIVKTRHLAFLSKSAIVKAKGLERYGSSGNDILIACKARRFKTLLQFNIAKSGHCDLFDS